MPQRDIFYDANLGALSGTMYTSQNSYVASADFQDVIGEASTATLTAAQMDTITSQVTQAHAKGLVARYCKLANHPYSQRFDHLTFGNREFARRISVGTARGSGC